jgi:hypothetical protein
MASDAGFWGRLRDLDADALVTLRDSQEAEGLLLEFKSFGTRPAEGAIDFPIEDLGDAFCSMANTAGGRVVMGAVEDRQTETIRHFVGISPNRQRATLQRVQAAAVRVQPPVVFDHKWVELPGSQGWILVLEIRRDEEGPRQHLGRYLMRVNSRREPMPHAMVVASIRSGLGRRGEGGWPGSPLDGAYPFETPKQSQGEALNEDWVLSALVRATFPVLQLWDPAGDTRAIVSSLVNNGVPDPIVLRTHIFSRMPDRHVRLDYEGSAWESWRGGAAPVVLVEKMESLLLQSIPQLARWLSLLGYSGPVEVYAKLSRAFTRPLQLQWSQDGRSATIMWATTECLAPEVSLAELTAADGAVPRLLTDRFTTLVSRNLDLVNYCE